MSTGLNSAMHVFWRQVWRVLAISAAINLLVLTPTLYMLQIYDRVMVSRNELTLVVMSGLTLALFSVMAALEVLRSRWLISAGQRLDADLGEAIFVAAFRKNLVVLAQSQRLVQRPLNDLLQLRQFLTGPGLMAFMDVPWTVIYIGVMFLLHPKLGMMGVLFVLVQLAMAALNHLRTAVLSDSASSLSLRSLQTLHGKLRNSEVIESSGMTPALLAKWRQRHDEATHVADRSQKALHQMQALSKFVRYAQQSMALGFASLLVIEGELSPGAMIASNVLMNRALAPIDALSATWRSFWEAKAGVARLRTLLSGTGGEQTRMKVVPAAPMGEVKVKDLTCSIPGREKPLCQRVSFALKPGTASVVVGPSGSGKSTLARAMLGLWPHVEGQVLLDDLPVDAWGREELGPSVGYLPQDVELFAGTVAENIARFGAVVPEQVVEAARAAGLHDMILRLPKGYDTPIGDGGLFLSAGQQQRVALARAMYGQPVLVVLDEPNSNLDDQGEKALIQAVMELKRRKCAVLLVTQRPGVLAVADRVLWMADGQLQAEGPPDVVLPEMRAAAGLQVAA